LEKTKQVTVYPRLFSTQVSNGLRNWSFDIHFKREKTQHLVTIYIAHCNREIGMCRSWSLQ